MLPPVVDPSVLAVFEQSLDRCTADKHFLDKFYLIFLETSDEIKQRFEHVDLKRQTSVLRGSLYFILRAASGVPDGMAHLRGIARSHDKKGYDIRPEFYTHWLESLLAAVAVTDPNFDDKVRDAWVATLLPCIEAMTQRWHAN